ncbi:PepSY domain-containing protein [Pseudomonas sp. v388]|uniref:PepSY-associated TM helix domain-containing protein n=1 Tax=Pseudomonas sp. v388 TaxID=2479849 RepID=UPI000F78E8B8|nr:PepSY-associated TM helix domain-containing protein [Pseudomonas sp. v388]RRV10315.1 PepSY domain-containing protein [Pseudomonas sp. v388]
MSEFQPAPAPHAPTALVALLKRLHFYIGLFVGPFLFVAALSGVLYALTPQIENLLYAHALHADSQGPRLSLAAQVTRAQQQVGPLLTVAAVRPAPGEGDTTRIMFSSPQLGASEHRALFIDPVSGEIRGDMTVYGTSGVLPLRTLIDQFHRGLLLGDVGRLYSELAASWLWVAALGGVVLWAVRRRQTKGPRRTLRGLHATVGLWLLVGLLFFSATGLTWSQYAGGNIGVLRGWYGWSTPSVATTLQTAAGMDMSMDAHHTMHQAADEHAEHHLHMPATSASKAVEPALFDAVLATARLANVQASRIEIRPAASAQKAWVVNEIDRRWPTQVDSVAINPTTLEVVDHVEFSDYSLPAKLTRWGIDAHMGVLFGLANQLLLVFFAGGLVVMVVMGYLMAWRRRPSLASQPTLLQSWSRLTGWTRIGLLLVAVVLGISLPVLGCSLLVLVVADLLLTRTSTARNVSRSHV